MRALFLIACAAIALGGCGKTSQSDTTQNSDDLTAASIVSNDVTAIDAVTGDAANMAEDVDMNFGDLEQNGSSADSNEAKPSHAAPAPAPAKPKATPEANSTANTTANSQ